MIQSKQNGILRILLGDVALGVTLYWSTGVLAAVPGTHEWAKPILTPMYVRQNMVAVQPFHKDFTSCFDGVISPQQQCIPGAPINVRARQLQHVAASDQSEPPPPTSSTPPSDLPRPIDPEPESQANLPGPALPPSVEPKPAKPGPPPPPMPEPAAPHLAPAPPPMPHPAKPPPLSGQPELNPADPGTPKQPTSSPQKEPEPTAYK